VTVCMHVTKTTIAYEPIVIIVRMDVATELVSKPVQQEIYVLTMLRVTETQTVQSQAALHAPMAAQEGHVMPHQRVQPAMSAAIQTNAIKTQTVQSQAAQTVHMVVTQQH
jgi:hypothetical protein